MKRFVNLRYGVVIPLCYALGLLVYYLFAKSLDIIAIFALIMPVIITLVCYFIKRKKILKLVVFIFACETALLFGLLNITVYSRNFFLPDVEADCVVTARFVGMEKAYGEYYYTFDRGRFTIEGKEYKNELLECSSWKNFNFIYGDVITFNAHLTSEKVLEESGAVAVNFLADGRRFNMQVDFTTAKVIDSDLTMFEYIRLPLQKTINEGMNEDSAGMITAMMFGDKSQLKYQVKSGAQFAGIAHIFAVSGLHVGFIAFAISALLSLFKTRRWVSCLVSIILTFIYCGICNFSASSTRALLMFSFYKICRTAGVKYDLLNSIFLSALLILLIKPVEIFTLGFILSYTAVISIAIFSKQLNKGLAFLPNSVSDNLSVTLSAQIGTLPISAYVFGYIPLIALFINFLLIPLISIIFTFAVISVFLATIFSFPTLLYGLNFIVNALISFVTDINFSTLALDWSSTISAVLIIYLGYFFSSGVVNLSFGKKLTIFTISSIIFILISQLFTAGIL